MRRSLKSTMSHINVKDTKLPYLKNCETYYNFDFDMDLLFYVWFMQQAFNEYFASKHLCSFNDFMEMKYPSTKKKRQ